MSEPKQCLGRYTSNKQRRKFPAKGDYFLEMRCPTILKDNSKDICESCYDKIKREELGVKTTNMTRFHGRINEPLSKDNSCWLYDSERFWKFANMPGNMPSTEALQEAVLAQRIARNNVEMKNTIIVPASSDSKKIDSPKVEASKEVEKSTKRKYTKKSAPAPAPAPIETNVTPKPTTTVPESQENASKTPEKKEVKKKPKKVILPKPQETIIPPAEAVAVASKESFIEPEEILQIQLRTIEIHDVNYWIDVKKDKLYKKESNGSIGSYIGRYDKEADSINRNFPDSDVE